MGFAIYDELLPMKPKTLAMAAMLKLHPDHVAGTLMRVWVWASKLSDDGFIADADLDMVRTVVNCKGFVEAMLKVKWLIKQKDGISFPDFNQYNWQTIRNKRLAAERKAKQRWEKERDKRGTKTGQVRDLSVTSVGHERDCHDANETETETETETVKETDIRSGPMSESLYKSDPVPVGVQGEKESVGRDLAKGRNAGPDRSESTFAQVFAASLCDVFAIRNADGRWEKGQIKSFMAVARRIIKRPDRDNLAAEIVGMAAEKKRDVTLRNPIAAWQASVGEFIPND